MMSGYNQTQNNYHFIFLPKDSIEGSFTLFRFLFKRGNFFYNSPAMPYVLALRKQPFLGRIIKNKFFECKEHPRDYKGLWYQINEEAIAFTKEFYDRNSNLRGVTDYLNISFLTYKFEAFIKKRILEFSLPLLATLYLAKNLERKCEVSLNRDKLSSYIIDKFNEKYKKDSHVKVNFFNNPINALLFLAYWAWLAKDFLRRGFSWKRKLSHFKILTEPFAEYNGKVLRENIIIDNENFTKDDVLFCLFHNKCAMRNKTINVFKEKGFCCVSASELSFNIRNNFGRILYLYFVVPLGVYFRLILIRQSYLLSKILYFFKQAFPIEVIMNRYNIGCNLSHIDHDDIDKTIVFNRYGTKNVIFHWSDSTIFKAASYAFTAHNIYFTWGDIHYDYHRDNYFIDSKINIGCIYKNGFSKALINRELIISKIKGFRKDRNTVSFFCNSCRNTLFTEQFFLDYLRLIRKFSRLNLNVNILCKPKGEEFSLRELTEDNEKGFNAIWNELMQCNNFMCLSASEYSAEEIMAISDVCVNMGITSASTIALICGKDALYLDNTGNNYHPFAKNYKNVLIFEDRGLLLEQIDNILQRKFRCQDAISQQEIRQYDAFSDDLALERLKKELRSLTNH